MVYLIVLLMLVVFILTPSGSDDESLECFQLPVLLLKFIVSFD